MIKKLLLTLLAAGLCVVPQFSAAQQYPDRLVKIVVPYTAGGGVDAVARALAQQLSEVWKQPVIIENKAGAGGAIGGDFVAKAAPDGYTLLFSDPAPLVINPHIYDKLPFDPAKELKPVALGVRLSPVLALSKNAPGKDLAEIIAYAKTHPDVLTYASPGIGNYSHVAMAYLAHMAGVKMVHVPYRGTNQVMPDLLSGRVDMFLVTISIFEQYEKDGRLRIIAAATDKRLPQRPDLPTVGETIPGYAIDVWFGLSAPAATPVTILDKINADARKVLNAKVFHDTFIVPQSYRAGDLTRQEFADLVKSEYVKWGELVKISGAKNPQ
jgi:tripartite-type tricarboxylate transporter receptor subunit TctC